MFDFFLQQVILFLCSHNFKRQSRSFFFLYINAFSSMSPLQVLSTRQDYAERKALGGETTLGYEKEDTSICMAIAIASTVEEGTGRRSGS